MKNSVKLRLNRSRPATKAVSPPKLPKGFWVKLFDGFTLAKAVLSMAFISGLLLTVWEVKIYQHTIIPAVYPILLWLTPGLIFTPVLRSYLNKIDAAPLALHLVYNICTWGGFVVFSFMAINFYGSNKQTTTIRAIIKDKGHLAKGKNGCGEAYADIEIYGKEKQIVFGCDDDIDKATGVILTLKQGLLGFDVIVSQRAQ